MSALNLCNGRIFKFGHRFTAWQYSNDGGVTRTRIPGVGTFEEPSYAQTRRRECRRCHLKEEEHANFGWSYPESEAIMIGNPCVSYGVIINEAAEVNCASNSTTGAKE